MSGLVTFTAGVSLWAAWLLLEALRRPARATWPFLLLATAAAVHGTIVVLVGGSHRGFAVGGAVAALSFLLVWLDNRPLRRAPAVTIGEPLAVALPDPVAPVSKPVVIVSMRGFWCAYCRRRLRLVEALAARLDLYVVAVTATHRAGRTTCRPGTRLVSDTAWVQGNGLAYRAQRHAGFELAGLALTLPTGRVTMARPGVIVLDTEGVVRAAEFPNDHRHVEIADGVATVMQAATMPNPSPTATEVHTDAN